MKKQLLVVLCAMLFFATANVMAQTDPVKPKDKAKGFSFGLGLEGALPSGALKDASDYKYGGGLSLRFTQGIASNFDLTLTGGAIAFVPEDLTNKTLDTKASVFIPIKLGGRLMLGNTFYLMAEAGMTLTKVYQATSVNMTNGDTTEGFVNGSTFTYAPGIGVRFGGLDLGLRYEGISDVNGGKAPAVSGGAVTAEKSGGFLGLRIGYDF